MSPLRPERVASTAVMCVTVRHRSPEHELVDPRRVRIEVQGAVSYLREEVRKGYKSCLSTTCTELAAAD